MELDHQERMKRYEYLGSEQHRLDALKSFAEYSHAAITPPWEE